MTTYRVPYTFVPGTKAKATEVNANFSSVVDLIEEVNTNCLDKNLSNLTNTGRNVIYNSSQSKMIGEIVVSTIPLSDSGLHLLDGSLLDGNGMYSSFVTHMAGLISQYPNMFCSEETWQASITNYGVCGKFVYNSTNNTLRLPKITGITEGTNDTDMVGDLIEAGLPNIIGGATLRAQITDTSGAIYVSQENTTQEDSGGGQFGDSFAIDASLSSSIYGNSSTVQPQTTKVLYYIVIATTTKTEIQADIDEIATDLNSKADKDLGNITPTSFFAGAIVNAMDNTTKSTISGWCLPDYSSAISISTGAYTPPADGLIRIGGGNNGQTKSIIVNNVTAAFAYVNSNTSTDITAWVQKDDNVRIEGTGDAYFYPLKGAN